MIAFRVAVLREVNFIEIRERHRLIIGLDVESPVSSSVSKLGLGKCLTPLLSLRAVFFNSS